jgi:hypothetical protein
METGVRQLHLRLNSNRTDHGETRRLRDEMLEQRGLPDARLAAQHESATLAAADIGDQLVQEHAFAATPAQLRERGSCGLNG